MSLSEDFPEARVAATNPRRVMVPCFCVGTCSYLVIERYAQIDGWDDEFYADVYVRPGAVTWRWRVKSAWRVLLGQSLAQDMTIDVGAATLLRDWLTGCLTEGSS